MLQCKSLKLLAFGECGCSFFTKSILIIHVLPTTAGIPDTVATSTVLHNFVIIPVVLCMVYQIL